MKTPEYWAKRFNLLEQSQHDRGAAAFSEIDRKYRTAEREIERKIAVWYQRFADNNGITLQEAQKWLSGKDLEEFKWDVNQYIRYGQENAVNGTWVKQLENASARFHISRLEALKIQCQQDIEVLFGGQKDVFDQAMSDVYRSAYYRTAFEIHRGVGIGWDFVTLDSKTISKIINKPWAVDGTNFSDRIWSDKQKLLSELDSTLTQNIVLGHDPQKAIDTISHRLGVSKANAGRLVMTEEAYFASEAQNDCFKELDVEQYEIVATLDSRTSEICRMMDGKVFKMSEWKVGVTAPPFHPWCRTTTVPHFDDEFDVGERAARGADGKTYYVPTNMKYADWEKAFVQGNKTEIEPVQPVQDQVQSGTMKVQDRSKAQPASDPAVQKILDRYPVIEGVHSALDDIKATNPKYAESRQKRDTYYTHNCQRCVNAYEARRRGYDVTAHARLLRNDTLPYMMNDRGWANVYVNGRDSLVQCFSRTAEGVQNKVISQMQSWGDGARAIVRVQWRGGAGGHVFIAENHAGDIVFMDPQSGAADVGYYFQSAKVNQTHLLRIDDKEFSDLIQDCCDYELPK